MRSFVRPDGCSLVFETHGDAANPPILLIEGMGGDIPGWRRTVANLEGDLFVITYDQRGNGWSDAPDEPQTMTTFVDDALAVLDHLGVERAHIYGQSFGGMVAAELALDHPDRVLTVILAATHAGGDAIVRTRATVPKEESDLAIFAASYPATHPDDVAELYRSGIPQQPHAGRRQWEAMQGYAVRDRLAALTMPVLVLHGDGDRVVDVGNATVLHEAIPGSELIILTGAGHVYQWEQPDASDAAILDFIGRHA